MLFENYKLSALPSPLNVNYYKLNQFVDVLPSANMPSGYLVKPFTFLDELPIFDQGNHSDCVAQAASYLQAINQAVETKKPFTRLSPGFIYGNRQPNDHQSEGMFPVQMLANLVVDGVPSYESFPEEGSYLEMKNLITQRKQSLLPSSVPNKPLSYVQLSNAQEVKTALMLIGAVLICIDVTNSFYNTSKNSGIVPEPFGSSLGGHCMLVVGYTTINGIEYYIVVNSWGESFGKHGICYLPTNYKNIRELWSVTDYQKRDLTSVTKAKIASEGAFVAPARTLFESIDGIVEPTIINGKKAMTAIIPPNITTRKITIIQDSPIINVETIG